MKISDTCPASTLVEAKRKQGKPENLKPCRSTEEAKERGRRGGLASGEARRERRAMRELLEMCLAEKDETTGHTNDMAIMAALVNKSKSGDTKAVALLLDIIGEAPKQSLDLTNSDGSLTPCHVDFSGMPQAEVMAIVDQVYAMQREANHD